MKMHSYNLSLKWRFSATVLVGYCLLTGCSAQSESHHDSDSVAAAASEENFSADNDIAMTVSSIADAINVGEPLDTAEYNFEGVLTDGYGTPLYTDIQGAPGEWEVSVVSHDEARIRNIYVGDLLPDSLMSYILHSLSIPEDRMIYTDRPEEGPGYEEGDTEETVYDLGNGELCFLTKLATAPGGQEGPLMSITLRHVKNHRSIANKGLSHRHKRHVRA